MKKKRIFSASIFLLLAALSYPVANNYLKQEHLLFLFCPLEDTHQFSLPVSYEEKTFTTEDNGSIHCVRLKVDNPKGVVVYYHGQGVNIQTKGKIASKLFNNRNYDLIMIDYRGFGKSKGSINQTNLYQDCLFAYDWARELYPEDHIVVYGSSLGTSMAAFVASQNSPKMLILESPYYNMIELGKYTKPYLPTSIIKMILKYPMRTDIFLENVKAPIYLLHGTNDSIIPYESSVKLYGKFNQNEDKQIELFTIEGAEHNNITKTIPYQQKLDKLLG